MNKSKVGNDRPIKWIFNCAVVITIIFNQFIADPFNSPKFWTLLLCASLISGYTLMARVGIEEKDRNFYKTFKVLLTLYLLFSFISAINSYNPQISFLGDNFRRDGVLTFTALSIFMLAAVKYSRIDNLNKIVNRIMFVGLITAGYSLIQIAKKDFIQWSDPNQIISTLGNSNFAGAAMAIFAIVSFGQILIKSVKLQYKFFSLLLFLILSFSIQKTNARQALYIMVIGIFIMFLIRISIVNKKLFKITLLSSIPISIFSILGMLQIGPLQSFLYKGTITIRGYYWRAGIEMFKAHPLFGVGIDNYGKFFKEYRESTYSLKYGYGITSTNAHNIFIQNYATGGIFVGTLYILIQIIILYRSLQLLRHANNEDKTKISIIFAAWIAFQAQSLISIDFIGLSIWGWLLGGTLLGLTLNLRSESTLNTRSSNKSIEVKWKYLLVPTFLFLSSVALIFPLYIGERYTFLSNSYNAPNNSDPNVKQIFKQYADRALSAKFINNDYRNIVIGGLINMGYSSEALEQLTLIIKNDPRNLDTLSLFANSYEKAGNYQQAIKYRKEIARFDPWNAQNYLGLAQLYRVTNDPQNMALMVDKILSFASSDPIAEVAKKEFTQTLN